MKFAKYSIYACLLTAIFFQGILAQAPKLSPEMAAARQLITEKKWIEAEAAYSAILKTDAKNSSAWFFLGFAQHSQEKWVNAIEAFKKNVELANTPAGMYKVAAGYARLNQKDEAFDWLEKALNSGAAFQANIEKDNDFDNIRSDARFTKMQKIVEQQRNPCMYSPEARQFDFWLGDWDVFVGGNKVGENLIEMDTQGCTLVENWKSARGGTGKSLNVYDPSVKKWKQFYVGGQGGVFLFEGDFREKDKHMYFTAETIGSNGAKTMHIFEFFDLPDKTVQQRWKQSTDEGKTWNTVWDSIYRKKAGS